MNVPFISPLLRRLLPRPPTEVQVGVIPYARVGTEITYLIITSRGTGKWIFPKGSLDEREDPRTLAAKEAREEAGIAGIVAEEPIGSYRDWKTRGGQRIAIEVALYPMLVTKQFTAWEEATQRYRHWVTLPELRDLIPNPAIIALAAQIEGLPAGKS